MKRALIVEDEIAALERILDMAMWRRGEFSVCATAKNGREALEAFERERPDVLITDILMPVMDGLDLIREVRRRSRGLPVIILSCHEKFSYAREAVRLGVNDYLIKGFMAEEALYLALRRVFGGEVEASGGTGAEAELERARSDRGGEALELMLGGTVSWVPIDRLRRSFAGSRMYCLFLVHIDGYSEEETDPEAVRSSVRGICEPLAPYGTCCIGDGNIAVLAGDDGTGRVGLEGTGPLDLASRILVGLRHGAGVSVTIALGRITDALDELPSLFDEARKLIRYRVFLGKGRVIVEQSIVNVAYKDPSGVEKKLALIDRAIAGRHRDRTLALLEEIFEEDLPGIMQYHYIEYVQSALLTSMIGAIERTGTSIRDVTEGRYIPIHELERLETLEEMHAWFRDLLLRLFGAPNDAGETVTTNVNIQRALDIIRSGDGGELSLEGLSRRLGIHRVYFCRLFKQEVGVSFYRYVQRRRIETAKELLAGTTSRMYDVAREAGFRSYDQFSVAFKRATGITPSDFREKFWNRR